MKKSIFSVFAGASFAALSCLCGCSQITPAPVKDANAPAIPASIDRYSSDILLFEERRVPLMVRVACAPSADEVSVAGVLNDVLNSGNIQCAAAGKPFDVQINIRSEYKELTPAPGCRLNHMLTLNVSAADGTRLLPEWTHKTEGLQAYSTAAEAKAKMLGQVKESIKVWNKNVFSNETDRAFRVTIVRFRLSKRFIELPLDYINRDLKLVRDKIKSIDGVYDLRMIEVDTQNRIATFRILHRSDVALAKQIKDKQ